VSSRPNIRLNCGASASEQPQPPESAGAAGIDLSVEVTTAAQPGDIQRGSTISAKIEAELGEWFDLEKICSNRRRY